MEQREDKTARGMFWSSLLPTLLNNRNLIIVKESAIVGELAALEI
jgi:hypothetical protein